jgi:ribosomal protein L29
MTAEPILSFGKSSNLYEADFYAWTQEQAKLLQQGTWSRLDIPNLVEEINSLGKQERQELENRLGVLLGHLLKWEFQSSHRSRSWFATIREQRRRISRLIERSPSLQPYLPEAVENAYQDALDLAVRETLLSYKNFPPDCPYQLEQILDFSFFPGEQLESDQDWE